MPDATEILTQDHRNVEQLFERYKSSKDPSVVREICTELTIHSAVEERVVYPVLGEEVDGGQGMRRHSEQEHAEVKDEIFQISRVGYDSPQVDGHMQKIMAAVQDHVEEEENDVFPKMRDDLGEEELSELGARVQSTKQELLMEAKTAGPLIELTKERLEELAREKNIEGRSSMSKEELISALSEVA
jgi:hemerythrin superfamily protein